MKCCGICGLGGKSGEFKDGLPGATLRRLGRLDFETSRSTLDLGSEVWPEFCDRLTEEDFQDLRMDFLTFRSLSSLSGSEGVMGVVGRVDAGERRTG